MLAIHGPWIGRGTTNRQLPHLVRPKPSRSGQCGVLHSQAPLRRTHLRCAGSGLSGSRGLEHQCGAVAVSFETSSAMLSAATEKVASSGTAVALSVKRLVSPRQIACLLPPFCFAGSGAISWRVHPSSGACCRFCRQVGRQRCTRPGCAGLHALRNMRHGQELLLHGVADSFGAAAIRSSGSGFLRASGWNTRRTNGSLRRSSPPLPFEHM